MTRATGALVAGLLVVVAHASACARVKSEPQTPSASPPVEPPQPGPPEPRRTAQPEPAEPPQANPVEPSRPKAPAAPPPRAAAPPPARPTAEPPPPVPPAAIVDLDALEERLRDTSAIGLFTKLALRNEVEDLLERFRTFHQGRGGATLAKLRESYDLLVLKVVSLLQDRDPPLARDIFTSREALWKILADPVKFKTLGFASTRGFVRRRE